MKKIKEKINKEMIYYIIIILIALVLGSPLTVKGFFSSHDGIYHFSRNYATNYSILAKQIPPLIVSNFCKGFGYGWNIFYPPLGTYINGVFSVFVSTINAMKLTILFAIIMSGITMFKLLKKITQNSRLSLITAVIYISSTYFLSNIYCRMAMGEIMAYVFFPILFYGLYDIFYDIGKENYYLAIGALGIVLSHNISTLMAIAISIIFVLLNIKKLFCKSTRVRIWRSILINLCFIILISLFFYVPLLEHKNATEYAAFSRGADKQGFLEQRLYPYQLIFGKNQLEWAYRLSENKINNSMSFSIGLPIIVALVLTPITITKIEKKYKSLYILTLCTGFIFALMSTTLFPWEYLPVVPSVIQFPWRLLFISTFAFSIIAGVNIYKNISEFSINNMYIILLIIMMCSGNFISNVLVFDTEFSVEYLYKSDKLYGEQCAAYEYLPRKAYDNLKYISERSSNVVILDGKADILNEQKESNNMNFVISNNDGVSLELPFIYYLGYDIKMNEKNIKYKESTNGFISIDIPKNETGIVTITYRGTKLEKISFISSFISIFIFIGYIIIVIKKNKNMKMLKNVG